MAAPSVEIGLYEIISELGRGGMATLYLARRKGKASFVREVAIKVVHEHLRDDAELRQMFLHEARVSSRVRHPNVVQVEDLGEHDGQPFLVMEYVDGVTLSDILAGLASRGESLPIPVAIALISQVADGLHAAHEAFDERGRALGIIHRDVSPQNVLVSARGIVKLIDFGIAKSRDRASSVMDGSLKGKMAYMSPEQARGKTLDRRADIYALAIVLWEVLLMRRLFSRATDYETYQAVAVPSVPAPDSVRSDIAPEIVDVVLRALSPAPEDRPQTAQQLRRELLTACREATLVDAREIACFVTDAARDVLARRRALAGDFADRTVVSHQENVELDDSAVLVGAEDIEDTPEKVTAHAVAALTRGDLATATMCKTRVVMLHAHAGNLEMAEQALREAVEMTTGAAPALRGHVESANALLCIFRGQPLARLRSLVLARELLERGGWVRRATAAAGNIGDSYNRFGAYAASEDACLEALARARQLEMPTWTMYALLNLGYSRCRQDRLTEAEHDLGEALRLALEHGRGHGEMCARTYRADVLARSGRMLSSRGEAELALELAKRSESPHMEALASIRVARAAVALGDAKAGLNVASRAHQLLTELGMLSESEAELFLVFHRALEAVGERERAKGVLEEGRRRLLETAGRIDDAEWKRRFLEDVASHRVLLVQD